MEAWVTNIVLKLLHTACNACYTAWAHAAPAQAWQHPTLRLPGVFMYGLAHWQTGDPG